MPHLISSNKNTFHNLYLDHKANIKRLVKDSAQIAIAGLSLAAIGAPFVESSRRRELFVKTIAYVTLTIAAKELIKEFTDKLEKPKANNKIAQKINKAAHWILNFFPLMIFNQIDYTHRILLVHEGGHALASKLLYQASKPKITLFPFAGAETRYLLNPLSNLGNFFGKKNSSLLRTAGGPGAATLLAISDLAASHLLKDHSPLLSNYLTCSAIMNIVQHCSYALSSFYAADRGHDFVTLWKEGGIHPLVSCSLITGLPYLINKLFFSRLLQ